jgi:hypothetical protein
MNSDSYTVRSKRGLDSSGSALWFSILVVVILCANAVGILEKPGGLLANPKDGAVSDAIRLLVFLVPGLLAVRLGNGLVAVALWTLGLGFVDKVFVATRVAWVAAESVPSSNLFLGAAAIYLLTMPLLLMIAFLGYYSAKLASDPANRTAVGSMQANVLLTSALGAFVVYFVFAINSYLLLWIADFPIFYLSLSQRTVTGLFYVFVGIAAVALIFWIVSCLSTRQMPAWWKSLSGSLFLLAAVAIHWANPSMPSS